mgnify:CR=1 FL=1|tara:strand:+ start:173 stop:394 length:222 start_codon:yes stop_codon:yes gene_type:complete
MLEEDKLNKAYEVAELLTRKHYKTTVHDYLLKYKNTVLNILIEEETAEGLEELFKFLEINIPVPEEDLDGVIH